MPCCLPFSRFSSDHPSVGYCADSFDAKALSESVHQGHKGLYISSIAWPHLPADRPDFIVEHRTDYHLIQVRPMILAIPFFPECQKWLFTRPPISGLLSNSTPKLDNKICNCKLFPKIVLNCYCHKIQLDFAIAGLENNPTSLSGKSGKAISDR